MGVSRFCCRGVRLCSFPSTDRTDRLRGGRAPGRARRRQAEHWLSRGLRSSGAHSHESVVAARGWEHHREKGNGSEGGRWTLLPVAGDQEGLPGGTVRRVWAKEGHSKRTVLGSFRQVPGE